MSEQVIPDKPNSRNQRYVKLQECIVICFHQGEK